MFADLKTAKAAIEANTDIQVEIAIVWIDKEAGWQDYTLVSVSPKRYQILSPRDVSAANEGKMTLQHLQDVIDDINRRGW